MLRDCSTRRRRGAVALEAAVVYPVLLFLLLMLIVAGMGVHRYQQVACLAREAARWTSVRGSDWEKDAGRPSPTQADVRRDAVLPLAAGMDPDKLSVRVQWVNGVTGEVLDWDAASKEPTTPNATDDPVANRVRVTVTYQWSPDLLLAGPLTLRSVSETPLNN